jgi:hypothetical protein
MHRRVSPIGRFVVSLLAAFALSVAFVPTVQAASVPTVTSISPVSGPLAGGTVVTITGTNLTGTTQVLFGTVAGTGVTNVSATQVKATAPAGAVGPVLLTLLASGGSAVSTPRYVYLSSTIASPGGTSVTVSSPVAGQDAFVSFEGSAGQRVAFDVSGVTYGAGACPATLSVLGPDGAALTAATGINNGGLHRFTGSADARLMKVQVTVTNRGGTSIVGLHYRRGFDWDVTPAEFSESVTFAKVPNADDSFVRYASDDGCANPDPALPPTYLGAAGYFTDQGPDENLQDRGGQVDISLGDLQSQQSLFFTIYYGVTADRSSAIQAVEAVDAQVYGLGQAVPYDDNVPEPWVPITAVFAIDGSSLNQRADPWLQGTRGDPVFQWCIHHACRLQRIAHQDR